MALLSWRGSMAWCGHGNRPASAATSCWCCRPHFTQWGADLDALLPCPHHTNSTGTAKSCVTTPAQQRHSRRGRPGGGLGPPHVDGTSQWLRWQSPRAYAQRLAAGLAAGGAMARNPGDAERRAEVALLPLADWQVFYFRGDAWSKPMSSSGTPPGDFRRGARSSPRRAPAFDLPRPGDGRADHARLGQPLTGRRQDMTTRQRGAAPAGRHADRDAGRHLCRSGDVAAMARD